MTARAGRALVAAGLIVFALASVARPAAADASIPGGCTDGTGVTVIVDFQAHLGGAVRAGCAEQPVTTGLDALTKAGFQVDQATHVSGVFICRIDDQPADDPCQGASPASAYWSYWYAAPGGSWTYSSVGAGGRTPAPGTVEGWSFAYSPTGGEAPPPRIAPPTAATGSAGAQPGATSMAAPPAPPPDQGGSSGPGRSSAPTSSVAGDVGHPAQTLPGVVPTTGPAVAAGTTPGESPTTVGAGASTTSTTTQPAVQVESAQKSRSASVGGSKSSGGAAVGSIVALLAIVAAGTGAGIVSRRRARAE